MFDNYCIVLDNENIYVDREINWNDEFQEQQVILTFVPLQKPY